MEMAKCFTKMEIITVENGSTEKEKGEVYKCIIKVGLSMKENGKIICQTVKAN